MFFKKKEPVGRATLLSVVRKTMDTGFVFWNVSDDLGQSSKQIMSSTSLLKMSYGYARRSAAAALYVQGLFDRASYEHAVAMFKALQHQTEHTVEFQEAAAADASEYLRSYHYLISGFFEKKVIQIANEYEIPKHRISDAELFGFVIETAYEELTKATNATPLASIISGVHSTEDDDDEDDDETVFTPREDTRIAHIAAHLLNLSTSNLELVGMAVKAEQAEELVQACADQVPAEMFESGDTKVVAMAVMLSVARNAVSFNGISSACMFSMSVIWAAKKMEEDAYRLTDGERAVATQLETDARDLLTKYHGQVDEIPAKLWIATTLASNPAQLMTHPI